MSAMCDSIGISRSTMSNLKHGRAAILSTKTAQKIADYLGVSVDEVLHGRSDYVSDEEDLYAYLQLLKDNPGLRMLLDHTKNASKEDIEAIVRVLGLGKNEN